MSRPPGRVDPNEPRAGPIAAWLRPSLSAQAIADKLPRNKFIWRGLDLHFGRRKTRVLSLVADATYSHLYRIRYPDGWTSTPANLSRARDAAYGHVRYLLGAETVASASYSPEPDLEAA